MSTGFGLISDTDPNIVSTGNWQANSSTHPPTHSTNTFGSSMSFRFVGGNFFAIVVLIPAGDGNVIFDYSVDGSAPVRKTQASQAQKFVTDFDPQLSGGTNVEHDILITNRGGPSDSSFMFGGLHLNSVDDDVASPFMLPPAAPATQTGPPSSKKTLPLTSSISISVNQPTATPSSTVSHSMATQPTSLPSNLPPTPSITSDQGSSASAPALTGSTESGATASAETAGINSTVISTDSKGALITFTTEIFITTTLPGQTILSINTGSVSRPDVHVILAGVLSSVGVALSSAALFFFWLHRRRHRFDVLRSEPNSQVVKESQQTRDLTTPTPFIMLNNSFPETESNIDASNDDLGARLEYLPKQPTGRDAPLVEIEKNGGILPDASWPSINPIFRESGLSEAPPEYSSEV